MTHRIVVTGSGSGPGGSAESLVTYTPSHDVPAVQQIHKVNRAARVLERLNDFLYGDGPDPSPDE